MFLTEAKTKEIKELFEPTPKCSTWMKPWLMFHAAENYAFDRYTLNRENEKSYS